MSAVVVVTALAHSDALIGAEIGTYRVDALIGEGGMGRVYRGIDLRTGTPIAMKVIAAEHARDPELIKRFYAEATAASRIRHPNIVQVFAIVYLPDGRPAIVMELVEGITLGAVIRAGTVPIGGAIDIMVQVLDALASAHDADIVHRDIKPDNILITSGGRAKVLDFGIAKLLSHEGSSVPRTKTGLMLGTPDYMAPEQIKSKPVDARTDIYSAGVVLYEAFVGQRPFDSPSPFQVLQSHLDGRAAWPSKVRPALPEALSLVVMRAMAKSRTDRFQSASAMVNALVEAASYVDAVHWQSVQAKPIPRTTRPLAPTVIAAQTVAAPPTRRAIPRWLVIALGLLLVIALVAIVAR